MSARLFAAVIVAVLFGLAQLAPESIGLTDTTGPVVRMVGRLVPSAASAAPSGDNNDSDNGGGDNSGGGDNGGSADNGGSDNGGSGDNGGSDNGSEDNSDSGSGNGNSNSNSNANGNDNRNENGDNSGNGNDNGSGSGADNAGNDNGNGARPLVPVTVGPQLAPIPRPARPTATPVPCDPLTEASGTSNGGLVSVAIGCERVVVRLLPALESGITVTVRFVDPAGLPPVPGAPAGDLFFTVEAYDANGAELATLPAEVNLNVRYDDADVEGLDEQALELAYLDPGDQQWRPAPKLVRDDVTNFVAASITELGVYAVRAP